MVRIQTSSFSTAEQALTAALAKRSGTAAAILKAFEEFGSDEMGVALAERLVAPELTQNELGHLGPWMSSARFSSACKKLLILRVITLVDVDDPMGLRLATDLIIGGVEVGPHLALVLSNPLLKSLSTSYGLLAAKLGEVDPQAAENLGRARESFSAFGAPVDPLEDLVLQYEAAGGSTRPRKSKAIATNPTKVAAGLKRHYEIDAKLKEAKPAPWRRFLLSADATWEDLHVAIQQCSGSWNQSHLWALHEGHSTRGEILAGISMDGQFCDESTPTRFEPTAKLAAVIEGEGQKKLLYNYDFGDDWQVTLTVRKVVDEPQRVFRRLIAGALAFPPEDCGGIPGYWAAAKTARSDPADDDEEAAERRAWMGSRWHPDAFDLGEARLAFDSVKRPGQRRSWRSRG